MTIAPHFFTGAVIATTTTTLSVAFLLGFLSHFVLDALPHLDPGTFFSVSDDEDKPWPAWIYIFTFFEFVITVLIFYFLFKDRWDFAIISMGAIGATTVDILDNSPLRFIRKLPVFKQLHWLHKRLHYELPSNKWFWGIPFEIIFIVGSIWYLLKY